MKTFSEYKIQSKAILSQHWEMLVPLIALFSIIPAILIQARHPRLVAVSVFISIMGSYFIIKAVLYAARNETKINFMEIIMSFDTKEFLTFLCSTWLTTLYLILWIFIPFMNLVKTFSYALVPYLALDNPGSNPNDLVTKSRHLMDGKKMDLFLFQLSFILWYVASFLTFGILSFYVIPYVQIALTLFYLDCSNTPEEV